ncbi:MAG TPA: adenylate/guanylate cyclase domain-containing protein [Solirubrobacteraceae bacterium]|jgi:class 3 adenylate cyclase
MTFVANGTRLDPTPVAGETVQRRRVTALSVDVVGSMSLCSSMSIESWWTVIERVFTIVSEGVERFGGWVENFAGDGGVAVFASGNSQAEQAIGACAAALWLRDTIDRYGAEFRRHRGFDLSVRIGVNSGDAVIGALVAPPHPRVAAIGHAVGMAKRIETLAAPGAVYLSESTAALVQDAFELFALGTFEVRDAGAPLALFELVAPAAADARAEPLSLVAAAA